MLIGLPAAVSCPRRCCVVGRHCCGIVVSEGRRVASYSSFLLLAFDRGGVTEASPLAQESKEGEGSTLEP